MPDAALASRPMGRPATYDIERKAQIIEHVTQQIACGRALSRILREDEDMPNASTFWFWLSKDGELADKVERARETGVEALLSEVVDIADDTNADVYIVYDKDGKAHAKIDGEAIQRSKLRVQARMDYAAMIAPRKYGKTLDITSGGEKISAPAPVTLIDARIQSLAASVLGASATPALEADSSPSLDDLMD